jgi:Fe-S cluster assembly ATP-binding protein
LADLEIRNLHVRVEDREILRGVDLSVNKGELHALMGPNGSGKSTLASTIMGHPEYEVTEGTITFKGEDITEADPEDRAHSGLFLAFQYPVAIPGVSIANFLRMAINTGRKDDPINVKEFRTKLQHAIDLLDVDRSFTSRHLNDGFSGGEKKRAEILQMALLEPKLCVLDETDSGLDIDALKIVADGVNALRSPDRAIVVITHYQRLLDYIVPDTVHVLYKGQVIKSGDKTLAHELEANGYADIIGAAA